MTATHYLVMDFGFVYAGKAGTDTDDEFDAFTDQVYGRLLTLK